VVTTLAHEATRLLDRLYREDFRRLFATVLRLVKDFDLAEDMLQEAFLVASQRWPEEGIPRNPASWLVSVAHHKALDRFRRERRMEPLDEQHIQLASALYEPDYEEEAIVDDRLRLIFTCCHPALDPQVQVALTLREVCGLSTEAIASAFLVQTATLAQRLVRLLAELLPETEVLGLLALMLLNEARRPARLDAAGELVLLEDQDRSLWRKDRSLEGLALLQRALEQGAIGAYTLQAAISAEHVRAARMEDTDWSRIVHCYDLLLQLTASPVVALNRAVALALVQQEPERRHLQRRLAALESALPS
jgi:RNA polymerase sigma-70 factor (ECF subfamily)